ncbi:MAG TPA: riboflavin synthase [Burkholderiales bacterium]|nr:riboflavin synthase [Burkholderiales bacterium]
MFTGIVSAVGRIAGLTQASGGVTVRIESGDLGLDDVAIGDSIAVNGVCLTVVTLLPGAFTVDVSRETLSCTAGFEQGAPVNLEKALRVADRLGGHLVSGHVDGIGTVSGIEERGDNRVFVIDTPAELAKYIARKGSVTVNGVSLTVNEVSGTRFSVNLIPHTLQATNLSTLHPGSHVNLEVDMLARYLERLLEARGSE